MQSLVATDYGVSKLEIVAERGNSREELHCRICLAVRVGGVGLKGECGFVDPLVPALPHRRCDKTLMPAIKIAQSESLGIGA